MGSSLHACRTAGAFYIANRNTWIESNAVSQLETTANLKFMRKAVGMPDLHAGRGYPIGAAFFTQQHFYPALIGNDIGCGMGFYQTDLKCNKYSLDKLVSKVGSIDAPLSIAHINQLAPDLLALADGSWANGTIGGGNHFAELQKLDQVYDETLVQTLGLTNQCYQLLVHSGSRGLGQQILRAHVAQFSHAGLTQGSNEAQAYLAEHDLALSYARQNRQLIAARLLDKLRCQAHCLLDVMHNFVEFCEIDGEQGWLHRKGAAPSDRGLVMIPGSRGDYSYLVKPLAGTHALLSLAHGAGRKWLRADCKDRLKARFRLEDLQRTALGGRVICNDRELIFEEAPQAYKSIETVIESLQDAALISLVARFVPVLSYKKQGECC